MQKLFDFRLPKLARRRTPIKWPEISAEVRLGFASSDLDTVGTVIKQSFLDACGGSFSSQAVKIIGIKSIFSRHIFECRERKN